MCFIDFLVQDFKYVKRGEFSCLECEDTGVVSPSQRRSIRECKRNTSPDSGIPKGTINEILRLICLLDDPG